MIDAERHQADGAAGIGNHEMLAGLGLVAIGGNPGLGDGALLLDPAIETALGDGFDRNAMA